MRFLVLLLSLALLAAGPMLYLTKGAEARGQRIAALEALERHRVEMQTEASRGPAPSLEAIDRLRSDLETRRSLRREVTARILSYQRSEAATEENLRALAKTVALDQPRVEPLLRPMPIGELGTMRRHVIHAVLRSLERAGAETGTAVLDLKISREPRPLDLDPAFLTLRVDLTLRADATLLTRITESLLEVHPTEPLSDLQSAKLTVPDPKDLMDIALPAANSAGGLPEGSDGKVADPPQKPLSPPLVLVLAVDYIVAEVP